MTIASQLRLVAAAWGLVMAVAVAAHGDDHPENGPTELARTIKMVLDNDASVHAVDTSALPPLRLRDLSDDAAEVAGARLVLPELALPVGVLLQLPDRATPMPLVFVPEKLVVSRRSTDAARTLVGVDQAAGFAKNPRRSTTSDARPADESALADPLTPLPIDFIALALQSSAGPKTPQHLDDDFDYSVTTWRDRDDWTYFQIDITARPSLDKLTVTPRDVVFLVDASVITSREYAGPVAAALADALRLLNAGDRFNIVALRDTPRLFSTTGMKPADATQIDAAKAFLTQPGGEDAAEDALPPLFVADRDQSRIRNLVLITDGRPRKNVPDLRGIVWQITHDRELPAAVYAVGIGRRTNAELLDFLTYKTGGFTVEADRSNLVASTIHNLMAHLRYPVIEDATASTVGLDGETYPLHLPTIHSGERVSLIGRTQAQPQPFMMRLTGRNAARPVDLTFSRDLADAHPGDPQLRQTWAFRKLQHLYRKIAREGETRELIQEIQQLRKQYKIKTLY